MYATGREQSLSGSTGFTSGDERAAERVRRWIEDLRRQHEEQYDRPQLWRSVVSGPLREERFGRRFESVSIRCLRVGRRVGRAAVGRWPLFVPRAAGRRNVRL